MKPIYKILKLLGIYLVIALEILFVTPLLSSTLGLWGIMLAELVMLFSVFAFSRVIGDKGSESFNIQPPISNVLFPSILMFLGSSSLMNGASYLLQGFFENFTNTTDTTLYLKYVKDQNTLLAVLAIAVVPAVCEEIIFRGYLLTKFREITSDFAAALITGVMFALLHFDLYKLLPLMIMGTVFGYVAIKAKSVIVTIVLHLIQNAFSLVALYSQDSTEEVLTIIVKPITGIGALIISLGIGGLLIYFALRKFGVIEKRKYQTLICVLVAVFLIILGMIVFTVSMISIPCYYSDIIEYPETKEVMKEFDIEEDSLCIVYYAAYGEGNFVSSIDLECDGESVLSEDDISFGFSGQMLLSKGHYKMTSTISGDTGEKDRQCAVNFYIVSSLKVKNISNDVVTENK